MSIAGYMQEKNKKNVSIKFDINNFKDLDSWLKTLKYKFRNLKMWI